MKRSEKTKQKIKPKPVGVSVFGRVIEPGSTISLRYDGKKWKTIHFNKKS